MKFYCIGDEDTVRGFRLAGVDGRVVTAAAEADEALRRAAACPDHGIVILTQEVAAWIAGRVEFLRLTQDRPLLVEIPGSSGPAVGRKSLRQLAHAAVGVCVDKAKGT